MKYSLYNPSYATWLVARLVVTIFYYIYEVYNLKRVYWLLGTQYKTKIGYLRIKCVIIKCFVTYTFVKSLLRTKKVNFILYCHCLMFICIIKI